ncbi:MAG: dual specificity protein phosphatase family protein [Bdellovibrionales bacterium]
MRRIFPFQELSWIKPNLAISGCIAGLTAVELATRNGFQNLLEICPEIHADPPPFTQGDVHMLRLPTFDCEAIAPDMIRKGVTFIDEALVRQEKVLISCQHGSSRSVLMAACVLVYEGKTSVEAMEMIMDSRGQASPNPDQIYALLAWEKACSGRAIAPDAWMNVARVAYRHLPKRTRALNVVALP